MRLLHKCIFTSDSELQLCLVPVCLSLQWTAINAIEFLNNFDINYLFSPVSNKEEERALTVFQIKCLNSVLLRNITLNILTERLLW
jgi:hypothetical protein